MGRDSDIAEDATHTVESSEHINYSFVGAASEKWQTGWDSTKLIKKEETKCYTIH